MGREVRKVVAGWEHPKNDRGVFLPLYDECFEDAAAEWKAAFAKWESGDRDGCKDASLEFWEWETDPPERKYYRPKWSESERTHFQYYETVSEGTPLTPPFPSLRELAEYLAEHGEFNRSKYPEIYPARTFEEWMKFLDGGGWAPSMIYSPQTGVVDGVTAVLNANL